MSDCNLGSIFDEYITSSDQSLSLKPNYYRIRQLRCIQPQLNLLTACTTVTSIAYCKLDYCNSLVDVIATATKSCHTIPILRSLYWLTKRIKYKLLLLTYKVFTTTQPSDFQNLIYVQP